MDFQRWYTDDCKYQLTITGKIHERVLIVEQNPNGYYGTGYPNRAVVSISDTVTKDDVVFIKQMWTEGSILNVKFIGFVVTIKGNEITLTEKPHGQDMTHHFVKPANMLYAIADRFRLTGSDDELFKKINEKLDLLDTMKHTNLLEIVETATEQKQILRLQMEMIQTLTQQVITFKIGVDELKSDKAGNLDYIAELEKERQTFKDDILNRVKSAMTFH